MLLFLSCTCVCVRVRVFVCLYVYGCVCVCMCACVHFQLTLGRARRASGAFEVTDSDGVVLHSKLQTGDYPKVRVRGSALAAAL